MDVMFERVAGLDIGKKSVTVCVRTPGAGNRRHSETRTFRTMTRSLEVMADWLVEQGVTLSAMESISTYWKPVFYALSADEHGVHASLSGRTCNSSQSVTRSQSGRPDHWPRPRPSHYLNPPRIFLAKPRRR